LKVKNELPNVASQRLLLFHVSRNVLAQGMKLLGLIPLEEMWRQVAILKEKL